MDYLQRQIAPLSLYREHIMVSKSTKNDRRNAGPGKKLDQRFFSAHFPFVLMRFLSGK
jgi:hypothetical protein